MTPEQFEKAQPLMNVRDKLIKALNQCEKMCHNIEEEHKKIIDRPKANHGFTGGYGIHLSEYSDGSGDSIDMSGCWVADEVTFTVRDILQKKLDDIMKQLGEI